MKTRMSKITQLENLPEVSVLAKNLKAALLEMSLRLEQKQKVLAAYENSGAFALFVALGVTVMGLALKNKVIFEFSGILLEQGAL